MRLDRHDTVSASTAGRTRRGRARDGQSIRCRVGERQGRAGDQPCPGRVTARRRPCRSRPMSPVTAPWRFKSTLTRVDRVMISGGTPQRQASSPVERPGPRSTSSSASRSWHPGVPLEAVRAILQSHDELTEPPDVPVDGVALEDLIFFRWWWCGHWRTCSAQRPGTFMSVINSLSRSSWVVTKGRCRMPLHVSATHVDRQGFFRVEPAAGRHPLHLVCQLHHPAGLLRYKACGGRGGARLLAHWPPTPTRPSGHASCWRGCGHGWAPAALRLSRRSDIALVRVHALQCKF